LILLASSLVAPSAATATSTPISAGGIGIRLLAGASSSPVEPFGLTYVVERLAPGSRITREVEVSNTTEATADIVIFPAAASIANGRFSFAPGRSADSLSSWTTLGRSALHLAPSASARDTVTIDVPKSASAGERYAVVWAEVSAPSRTQSGVRLVNRVGVRMYVSVGRGGMPVAEFTVGSLAAGRSATGDPTIGAQVHNVGQAALDITGELTLSDGPGGLSAGPFPVTLGTMLAPGHSAIERVELDSEIPRGPWRADLSLSSAGTQRSSVAMITFPAKTLTESGRSVATRVVLAALIALVFLLAAATSSILISRRRLSRRLSRRRHLRLA
jgi:hypothetical protein